MIKQLHKTSILGEMREYAPDNFELMEKINEIIDKVNELEFKTQVTKWYTPEMEEKLEEVLNASVTDKEKMV